MMQIILTKYLDSHGLLWALGMVQTNFFQLSLAMQFHKGFSL